MRHAELEVTGLRNILSHLGDRGCLKPKAHLQEDRLTQRIDGCDWAKPPRLGGKPVYHPGCEVKAFQIAFESFFNSGPQNFHGNSMRGSWRCYPSLMHLSDGSRSNRRVEVGINPGPRLAER